LADNRKSHLGLEPSLQILTRPRQQEIGREGFSILLERHQVAILGVALAVVDHGEGLRRIAERWMGVTSSTNSPPI
jgi:hypothetical protein